MKTIIPLTDYEVSRTQYIKLLHQLDTAQQVILDMRKQLHDTIDELNLALEALRRAFPENKQKETHND